MSHASTPAKKPLTYKMAVDKSAPEKKQYCLLYRGNAIDGWISAFIAYTALKTHHSLAFYPLIANAPVKFQRKWKNAHILLLDLSIPLEERESLLAAGVTAIDCVDHHETSIPHWPIEVSPINTAACTSILVWKRYYPTQTMPFWLSSIDRISRWDHPTLEDRSLREALSPLARMAGETSINEALAATESFMKNAMNPMDTSFIELMCRGRAALHQKDQHLFSVLSKGRFQLAGPEEVKLWKLPAEWLGLSLYVLENTDIVIDSTEASYLIFQHYPSVHVFINYRKKVRRDPATNSLAAVYLYSARSTGFDLRQGGLFLGQATSAGATVFTGDASEVMPFHLPKDLIVLSDEEYQAMVATA